MRDDVTKEVFPKEVVGKVVTKGACCLPGTSVGWQ